MVLPRALVSVIFALLLTVPLLGGEPERALAPNYAQASKFSQTYLRQFVYSTSVFPTWIGKTDSFWYSYQTSKGTTWWRVDPIKKSKDPLFDHSRLAAQLSELLRKPLDGARLPITRVSLTDDGAKLKFVVEDMQYEYTIAGSTLTKLGKAPPMPFGPPQGFRGGEMTEEMRHMLEERQREREQQQDQQQQQQDQQQQDQQQQQQDRGGRGTARGGFGGDYRAMSPDKKLFVYAQKHNLFLVEVGKEKDAIQLTNDGIEDYAWGGGGFGFGGRQQQQQQQQQVGNTAVSTSTNTTAIEDRKTRPNVTWSKDSKAFTVTRSDSRGVQELFLVDSLNAPRPKLDKYKYAMPGEPAVRKSELHYFDVASKKLTRVAPKWTDESYTNVHFSKTSDELRFVRRDRLLRNAEFCSLSTKTGETKCLLLEGFENAYLELQPVRYLEESDEMVWWSERSGWGHYYVYGRDGKLKTSITSGPWRASRIVEVDEKNRIAYVQGNAREPGENVYYQHLYSVKLDGTGLKLLDPGDAHHNSSLSPSKKFVVDNCSRVDAVPTSTLRDADGKKVMDLEQADLSRLRVIGWKMPETFVVKAADGVTDLYGNMWKPFDFDPKKKYPIIANVYPGPQQEGVTHTFSASGQNQQLAQIGFIVIQVGHRGGAPTRSKAYHSFSYGNMRDYGLADKKAAIEQLAARFSFIDVEKVGIFGHSGGGFMSAAAMLQKPYNEFFKAAVASAGNHDNNIYNNSWAERYHGLKEVPVAKEESKPPEVKKADEKKSEAIKTDAKKDETKSDDKKVEVKKDEAKKPDPAEAAGNIEKKDDKKPIATRFEIHVPTNAELAANLKGALLLVHGEIDNNVHPANTMRLIDALIKANKRFDMLIIPGKRHSFGDAQGYFQQRMWEFFARHLLEDEQVGADMLEKKSRRK